MTPASAAMAPSTVICFALTCAVLLARISRAEPARTTTRAVLAVATFLACVVAVDLGVILSGRASGIDELVRPPIKRFYTTSMAPATAFNFLLTALCLFRLAHARTLRDPLLVTIATAGLLSALVALVGYAFDSEAP